MADVRRPPPCPGSAGERRDDRGQLFLVGALSLGVLFVGFALLLNTAIFTENLATRNTDPGTDPSISYRSAAATAAEEIMVRENANNTDDQTPSTMVDRYERSVAAWGDSTGIHATRRARFVDMTVDSTRAGTRFEQTNVNRNFTNASGTTTDWDLADDRDVRDVQFTVENASLAATPSGAFTLELESTDSSKVWNVSIYRASATEVGVEMRNETHTETCVATVGSHAVVDVSGGVINDTACPELVQTLDLGGEGVDVEFEDGDEAVGTFSLIVSDGANPSTDDDIVDNEADGSPFVSAVIYSADVTITYQSRDVYYRTLVDLDPPEEIR
jgi:cytoskeletal protein RodZ